MFDKKRLIEILNEFPKKKIVVIGDLMLDEYIIGSVTRISPEAPVPVVNVKKENFVLGGAANVVNNLSSLGVQVLAFGVIGNDNNGKKMLAEFEKKDVSTEYINILTDRPTIMKQRILANNQQLLRLDWEKKHPINSIEEDFIIDNLKRIINEVDGVILSDYDKGVLPSNRCNRKKYNPDKIVMIPNMIKLYENAVCVCASEARAGVSKCSSIAPKPIPKLIANC